MHGEDDERFMRRALDEARSARAAGEVPVGAVVALDGRILGVGHNRPVTSRDPSAHAEIVALRSAAARVANYRLVGATLYCTVEPCMMCVGAAIHARVARVVFGASDPKIGAIGQLEAMRSAGATFNHEFESLGGVLDDESSDLLVAFFRDRRGSGPGRSGDPEEDGTECGEVPKWS